MAKQAKTDKEDRFVDEYLIDLNATQAYLRSHPGTVETTGRTEGARLLANPGIQKKISDAKAARSARTHVSQDRVIRELARVGFSDMRHYVEWVSDRLEGTVITLKDSEKLTTSQARAVSEVSHTANGIKFKLHNKVRALEILLEHVRISNEDASKSEPVSFSDLAKKAAGK